MAIDIGTARKRLLVQRRMQRTPLPCLAMDATLPFLVVAGDGGLTTPGYHWKERSRRREEAAPDGRLWQSGTISAPGRLLALATVVKRVTAHADLRGRLTQDAIVSSPWPRSIAM